VRFGVENVNKFRKKYFSFRILSGFKGAGEIRETANLINPGNIFQEISEHFLRKTRIIFFIPGEWSKQPHHKAELKGGRGGGKKGDYQ
jgi:hypothetical protein